MTNIANTFAPANIAARDRALNQQVQEMSRISQLERQLDTLRDRLDNVRAENSRLQADNSALRMEMRLIQSGMRPGGQVTWTRTQPRRDANGGYSSDDPRLQEAEYSSGQESEGGTTTHFPDGGMLRRPHREHRLRRRGWRAPSVGPRVISPPPTRHRRMRIENPRYSPTARTPTRPRRTLPRRPAPSQPALGSPDWGEPSSPLGSARPPQPSPLVSPRTLHAAQVLENLGVEIQAADEEGSLTVRISPTKPRFPGPSSTF